MCEWNPHIVQTFNASYMYSPDFNSAKYFGPGRRFLEPETYQASDGNQHHLSYLQKKDKYKASIQTEYEVPKTQGIEQKLVCCNQVFRFKAPFDRHVMIIHSNRRRPTRTGRRNARASRRTRETVSRPERAAHAAAQVRPSRHAQAARNQAEAPGSEEEAPGCEAADGPDPISEPELGDDDESNEIESDEGESDESDSESELEMEVRAVTDPVIFNHEIRSVVGRRKRDNDGHTETTKPKGHCRLIHWGFEGGEDCPVDQCTWETLSMQKAPLDADELVGKDIHIKCSSRWYFASVESHVEGGMLSYCYNHYCEQIHCCRLTLPHLLFGTKG